MTHADFDVLTSTTRSVRNTRRAVQHARWARPIVRAAWIILRLCRKEPVTARLYKKRFGVSLRSFRRDIANIRDAGLYLDTDQGGDYRLLYFSSDSDA
ncbi:MAG TPA: HTH domain-containing protein [Xanthomonadales bacterium]|nr:HTH domain-containing protein [Xanthomonadales bacterium]